MSADSRRKLLLRLMLVVFGLGLPLALAELGLRFLPVTGIMAVMPLNGANPVLRYVPNQDVVWSNGWNFWATNKVHINNDGFINERDYTRASLPPVVAVIGDSYVEAVMVPFRQTLNGRLQQMVGQRARIYSFGKSGAPLSEYLAWAEHSRIQYGATAMVISVVGNDFDESLVRYRTVEAGHYYVAGEGGDLQLQRFDYAPKLYRRFIRQSALVRYLMGNVRIAGIVQGQRPSADFVGNVAATKSEAVVAESQRVVAAFFRDLPAKSGLPPERIVFTVDAMRPQLYQPETLSAAENSYFGRMRRHFIQEARARGYEVIDLQEVFRSDFAARGLRFEFPKDSHWNVVGHDLVAQSVAVSRTVRSALER